MLILQSFHLESPFLFDDLVLLFEDLIFELNFEGREFF